jgi:tetratricopeptide (TPR) repeat protein
MWNAFVRGEKTWAELEGMTLLQAREIAEAALELNRAGRKGEARMLFEGLVAGNPRDVAARAALGAIYLDEGRIEDALEELNAALQIDPSHPAALAHRGEARLRLGDSSGQDDLEQAVARDREGRIAASRRAARMLKVLGSHSGLHGGQGPSFTSQVAPPRVPSAFSNEGGKTP